MNNENQNADTNQTANTAHFFKEEVAAEQIEAIKHLSNQVLQIESEALIQGMDAGARLAELKSKTKHGKWLRVVKERLQMEAKTVERLLKLHKHRDALLEEMTKNDTTVSNLTSAYRFCNKLARELKAARKLAQDQRLDQIQAQVETMALEMAAETTVTDLEQPAPEVHVEVEIQEAA